MSPRAAPRVPADRPRRRGWPARLQRWLRVLLVGLAVAGLTPLVEAVEQLLAGPCAELVATAACEGDCDEGCEDAACHGAAHHCGCCAPAPPLAPSVAWRPAALRGTLDRQHPAALLGPPDRAPPPPWQPPRA